MFRKALLAAVAAFGLALPALAEGIPAGAELDVARLATMPVRELDAFVNMVALAVNQDSLKLRNLAQANDCLELTRAANSFALGFTYLDEAADAAAKRTEKEAPVIRARAIQVRVTTFAARTRAEEWLAQRCRNFVVPAEHADDPRYAKPAKVSNADYTDAVIEGRQAAETNLAIAVAAGTSGKCPDVVVAAQNIALLMPYLQKLLTDTAKRPEVLGPRASRRGLEVSRRQLAAALDKLQAEFGTKCQTPKQSETTPSTDARPE